MKKSFGCKYPIAKVAVPKTCLQRAVLEQWRVFVRPKFLINFAVEFARPSGSKTRHCVKPLKR